MDHQPRFVPISPDIPSATYRREDESAAMHGGGHTAYAGPPRAVPPPVADPFSKYSKYIYIAIAVCVVLFIIYFIYIIFSKKREEAVPLPLPAGTQPDNQLLRQQLLLAAQQKQAELERQASSEREREREQQAAAEERERLASIIASKTRQNPNMGDDVHYKDVSSLLSGGSASKETIIRAAEEEQTPYMEEEVVEEVVVEEAEPKEQPKEPYLAPVDDETKESIQKDLFEDLDDYNM